jgi:hypothetical protein
VRAHKRGEMSDMSINSSPVSLVAIDRLDRSNRLVVIKERTNAMHFPALDRYSTANLSAIAIASPDPPEISRFSSDSRSVIAIRERVASRCTFSDTGSVRVRYHAGLLFIVSIAGLFPIKDRF